MTIQGNMSDTEDTKALQPAMSLLCKLGSALVHTEELAGPSGHQFDRVALTQVIGDPEVAAWMAAMQRMSLLPVKRS